MVWGCMWKAGRGTQPVVTDFQTPEGFDHGGLDLNNC